MNFLIGPLTLSGDMVKGFVETKSKSGLRITNEKQSHLKSSKSQEKFRGKVKC